MLADDCIGFYYPSYRSFHKWRIPISWMLCFMEYPIYKRMITRGPYFGKPVLKDIFRMNLRRCCTSRARLFSDVNSLWVPLGSHNQWLAQTSDSGNDMESKRAFPLYLIKYPLSTVDPGFSSGSFLRVKQ